MSGNFVLTLTAPREYGVEKFDNDASIWLATDADKTSVSRCTSDPTRDSVMEVQGTSWKLGDGKTLGDGMYLGDSPAGMGEGAYEDYTVTPGVRYAFSCLYKMSTGTLTIELYDQTNGASISSTDKTDTVWKSYETSIVAPAFCTAIRVKFLQGGSDVKPGPFRMDDVSLSGNVLLYDPDNYSRVPERVGSFHQTLVGRRVYDLRAIHYSFHLGWNFFKEDQYENLREIYYSDELLYFDDGDVPPLIESERVYKTAQYDYAGITNPSSTHKAYSDSSSSLPSAKSDFETTEFATAEYQAIDGDDSNYKETTNPNADEYLYHKYLLLSSIDSDDVKRFRAKIAMSGVDSSLQNLDGGVLYAWNGANWVELARNTSSAKMDLTYSTVEAEVAKQFVDSDDNYVRLLLRSRNRRDGINNLLLRTYYVECEINEGLDLTIELSHKAILDENDDVIWMKNLTQGTTLDKKIEYRIENDRRSVIVGAVYATLDGSSQYFSGGDVLDAGTDDISISAWVKTTDTGTMDLVGKLRSGNTKQYGLRFLSGKISGYLADGVSGIQLISADTFNDGKWHHVAIVYDRSGNAQIYIEGYANGAPVDISAMVAIDISDNLNFMVGARNTTIGAYDHYFDGSIRDVRIWIGGVWSASEILYQATHPLTTDEANAGSLTSYWPLNDAAAATTIEDNKGSNDLTLAGGDTTNYGTHSRIAVAPAGDEIEVKYNRYFEVMFASIPEEWFSGDPSSGDRSAIARSAEVVLQTLSESR